MDEQNQGSDAKIKVAYELLVRAVTLLR